MIRESFKEEVILNITRLMLIFLPVSMVTNYLNDRFDFAILYLFIFIATIKHYFCFKKENDLEKASEQILVILFGLFFTFFIIGKQETFDILWVLAFPIVAVMTSSLNSLKRWLVRYLSLVIIFLVMAYFFTDIIMYNTFSLFSLLWASIFVSYISYSYKKNQNRLENEILSYQNTLESKIKYAIREIEDLNKYLNDTQIEILERLGTLGEYCSKETGDHVKRVGLYTKKLALLCGVSEEDAVLYERAAPLHDIGKVGIEDCILHKPAKLTKEEYETMKKHAIIGENILSGSDKRLIQIAAQIAGGHHEKYDGSGYPRGLVGEDIPLCARIVAISDVFDALYSSRIYKKAWTLDSINEYFRSESGLHFDPKLCKLFIDNIDDFVKIYKENS